MPLRRTPEEVNAWLLAHGRRPGREDEPGNRARADRLIEVRVRRSAAEGFPLLPWDGVRRFVASYVGLEFPVPLAPERRFRADPTFGYAGDSESITELAESLGRRLFPVGWETAENGIVLLDDTGRFFYLHHTGPYFLGADEPGALAALMTGYQEDAEDYYVRGSGDVSGVF
ncbi:SUKH-3 domain-containing protein [Streptomyces sp. NPDC020875]|uniref:SUKH-3 domain-containing protein n=1 Tax=Streptomyces sp. NPDC020875 TaxID=3154898 RepID=UPI0033DEC837